MKSGGRLRNSRDDLFPDQRGWQWADPTQLRLDPAALDAAVAFAVANDSDWPQSLFLPDGRYVGNAYAADAPPHDCPIGIVRPRGPAAGLVVRSGRAVASWGDIDRPDTSFSVAKSYLALLLGVALDDGLIRAVDDPVRRYMPADDDGFTDPHNAGITWRQLLRQTSEWQGTLWGIPDSVDRNRRWGPGDEQPASDGERAAEAPGSRWEYNDVRVNRLALALLRVFRKPLPDVLHDRIMDPIGASSTWRWEGYRNSIVEIDGTGMVSVCGGSHWGGGLFMSTSDHARTGWLVANGGAWRDHRIVSADWIDALGEPGEAHPQYGHLWWTNRGSGLFPFAPESSIFALGGGNHLIWVDRELELVVVSRWIRAEQCDGLIERIVASIAA